MVMLSHEDGLRDLFPQFSVVRSQVPALRLGQICKDVIRMALIAWQDLDTTLDNQ